MLVIIRQLLYGIWIIQINIKTIFKRILKYTLGASCKDCTDSTSCKSDIFKCTGSEFFSFLENCRCRLGLSLWSKQWKERPRSPRAVDLGSLVPVWGWLVAQLALGTAGGWHNSCTSSPVGDGRALSGTSCVSSQNPAFSWLLSKKSDFITVLKCLSVCQRKVFHFCGNQKLEYTEFVS